MRRILLLVGLGSSLWSGAAAHSWVLLNGDRITGQLIEESADAILIQHPHLGQLKIARNLLRSDVGVTDPAAPPTPPAPPTTPPNPPRWTRQIEAGYSLQQSPQPNENLTLRAELNGKTGPIPTGPRPVICAPRAWAASPRTGWRPTFAGAGR